MGRIYRLFRPCWQEMSLLILLLVCSGCGVPQTPGIRMYMRGDEYGRIRFNNNAATPQTVLIDKDGVLIRNAIPVSPQRRTWAYLSDGEFEEVQALQRLWCATPPVFPPADPAHNYDIGFRCTAGYTVTQWSVPPEAVPDILRQVIQRSPALLPAPSRR